MTKYYAVEPYVISDSLKKKLYTYNQLVQILANKKYDWLIQNDYIQNLTYAIGLIHFAENKKIYTKSDEYDVEPLTSDSLKKVVKDSCKWQESQKIKMLDYQFQYLKQANQFGSHSAVLDLTPHLLFNYHRPKSHSASGYKFSARAGKTTIDANRTYAVYFKELSNIRYFERNLDLPDSILSKYCFKLRHINRKIDTSSYVWDDKEHMRTRHSTGWKYSTKFKHQWQAQAIKIKK